MLFLAFRLFQSDQGPSLLAVGAEMDQQRHLVVGQVVEARLDDHRIIALDLEGDSLGLLIDRASHGHNLVGKRVLKITANDTILV